MTVSLSIIVPEALKANADAIAVALGHAPHGTETYVVPLSPTGTGQATHFGCHAAAEPTFVAALSACCDGVVVPPADFAAVGLTEADVFAVCAALSSRVRTIDDYGSNFVAHCGELGLQRIADVGP